MQKFKMKHTSNSITNILLVVLLQEHNAWNIDKMSKSIAVETSQTEVCLSIDLFWQQTSGNPIELSLFVLLFSIVLSLLSKNEWKCLLAQNN
jgi:hypothetical protein